MATTIENNVCSDPLSNPQMPAPLPPKPPDPPDKLEPLELLTSGPDKADDSALCLEAFVSPVGVDPRPPSDNSPVHQDIKDNGRSTKTTTASGIITLDPYCPSPKGQEYSSGTNKRLRVLYCTSVPLTVDYETIFTEMKKYGIIERIRLCVSAGKNSFEAYISYNKFSDAQKAVVDINLGKVSKISKHAKLYSIDNISFSEYDFVPRLSDLYDDDNLTSIPKNTPTPVWFIASYRRGSQNFIKGSECLERKAGTIPRGNLKHYGRKLLIKAGNEAQAILLKAFKPSPNDVIHEISPHRSFNNAKGIVFSDDLFDFSEEEILKRCPPNVIKVKKLNGTRNAVILTFSSPYLPEYITVNHLNISVKKCHPRPTQCFKCFEYGHINTKCTNAARCRKCSDFHVLAPDAECSANKFCFHCSAAHSPSSKDCSRYKLELEIVNIAYDEHISLGLARRKAMGGNKSLGTSYAKAASNKSVPPKTVNHRNSSADNTEDLILLQPLSLNRAANHLKRTSSNLDNDGLHSTVATADVHQSLSDLNDTSEPSTRSNGKEKGKITSNPADGFQSPRRTKHSRASSPPKFELKTSNIFSVLDPLGPLSVQQPLKKMALALSSSDINTMETCEINNIQSIECKEGTKESVPSTSSANKTVAPLDSSELNVASNSSNSRPNSSNRAEGQLNKSNSQKKSSSGAHKDEGFTGKKTKKLNFHFKSMNGKSHQAQSKIWTGRKGNN